MHSLRISGERMEQRILLLIYTHKSLRNLTITMSFAYHLHISMHIRGPQRCRATQIVDLVGSLLSSHMNSLQTKHMTSVQVRKAKK